MALMVRRLRLKRFLVASVSLLVLALLLTVVWLSVNLDMRGVERRALAAHLLWPLGEVRKPSYLPDDFGVLRRLDVAQHAIGRIESVKHVPYRRTVQRAFDKYASEISAMEAAVDQLSGEAITIDGEDLRLLGVDQYIYNNVGWYLGERIRYCHVTELDGRILRLCHFIRCAWPNGERDECLGTLLKQVAYRADDLRGDQKVILSLSGALDLVAAKIGDDFEVRLARDAEALRDAWHPDSWYDSTNCTFGWVERFSLGRKFMARLVS